MTITFKQIEKIFNTLPTSYYLGKRISATLSETESGSFYNPMADEVVISAKMIIDSLKNEDDASLIEETVRTLLYHEISHALLTPRDLEMTDIVNIFEDERIETLLRDFYIGVNFKAFCFRFNKFTGQQAKNAREFFYHVVRFRHGPKDLVERVSKLIKRFVKIDSNYSYKIVIMNFYNDCETRFNELKAQQEEEEAHGLPPVDTNKIEEGMQQEDEEEERNTAFGDGQIDDTDAKLENEEIEQQLETLADTYVNVSMAHDFDILLSKLKTHKKNTGSAINAYSGRFDPRSVVRNDYKWFVQQNRAGHVKAFSKLKLNLFIDRSGSFSDNDETVNCMLKALTKYERSNADFSFDLIACGYGEELMPKSKRIQKSFGGTLCTEDIVSIYKKVQSADAENINILLYDGDLATSAYSTDAVNRATKALRVFNNHHCICIFDRSNMKYADYVKHAKLIISNDYTKELYRNITQSLANAIR